MLDISSMGKFFTLCTELFSTHIVLPTISFFS
uniref:Uncharacterized protein n=1 Tax=Arundo donax TaxID=35708 RepID=A0A0A9FDS4_ARUDO